MSESLYEKMNKIFEDKKCALNAVEMTEELTKRGQMPEMNTVIDIADAMKEYYGPSTH